MTWDPRDLGAPKRVTHPPEPPAPPAPPPRSYELRLADWDDQRLTALTGGKPFHERIPEPDCEAEVPLYAKALEEEIARELYKPLLSTPKSQITTELLKSLMRGTIERVCEPPKFEWPADQIGRSFELLSVEETDDQVKERIKNRLSSPLGFKMVDLPPPPNDAALRYVHPSYPGLTPGMIEENHQALVERPARTMRDWVDALQYGLAGAQGAKSSEEPRTPPCTNGPTGPCGPVGDDYLGADWD